MRATPSQPGLALRVQRGRRTISAQHRQLDHFYLRVASALEAARIETARAAFARFSDALEAHLALEDGLYFPALRGLRPELAEHLDRLEDEHQRLRERLGRVARGALDRERLEGLADELADHEGREEALLASLRKGGLGR
jgi:hypothetical protein